MNIIYHFMSKSGEQAFEVNGISSRFFADLLNSSKNYFMFSIKTKSFSSHKNISNVGSTLSWISVKPEHLMKICNKLCRKDWIFSSNIFSEDVFKIFLLVFSFVNGHSKISLYYKYNLK